MLIKNIKEKGFTLIELIAVIIILGVLAFMAIPSVTKLIEDTKITAFERSVESISKAVDNAITYAVMNGDYSEKSYVYENGVSKTGDLDKYFKGKRPDEAIFHINTSGKYEFAIYDSSIKACAVKQYQNLEFSIHQNITSRLTCVDQLSMNMLVNSSQVTQSYKSSTYKDKIISIDFVDYLNVPKNSIKWDLTEEKNGRIMGWLVPTNNNMYKLYIGSEGTIYANLSLENMFSNMGNLETINFNNFSSINTTDMGNMFASDNKLRTIIFTNFDTSNVASMHHMFHKCESLTSLDVSKFNTGNVTNMNSMFSEARGLVSLDLSNFNTASVTDMAWMFYDNKNLTSLNLSSFNTNNVTDMNHMFNKVNKLGTLNLSNFRTPKVTDMSYMFYECTNMSNINVSHFDTSRVTDMRSMFRDMTTIRVLDITSFDTAKVENVNDMFRSSKNLKTIYVSNKWSLSKVSFLNKLTTFTGCGTNKVTVR